MRVAIITPEAPAHHKHFCAHLAARHEVVAVIHPARPRGNLQGTLRKARRRVSSLGVTYGALHLLASVRNPAIGWDWIHALDEAESRAFQNAAAEYDEAGVPRIARTVDDVNGASTVALVRQLSPDVVVCLGGPIYREPLIEACGTMVNFHSGVSPLYNGASTILFAFANGHVQLCGGTLMTMSPVVDGGDILAHFLPEVDPGDDPATLFVKTVRAAGDLSSRFLDHLGRTGSFTKSPQTPPLFRCTSADWTLYHTQRIRRQLERGVAAGFVRPERAVEYWGLASDAEANDRVKATIDELLQLR